MKNKRLNPNKHFIPGIDRAKEAFRNSGQPVEKHFVDDHEMVGIEKLRQKSAQNH